MGRWSCCYCRSPCGQSSIQSRKVHGYERFGFEFVQEVKADRDGGLESETKEDFDIGNVHIER
jgi:hypothetical protein